MLKTKSFDDKRHYFWSDLLIFCNFRNLCEILILILKIQKRNMILFIKVETSNNDMQLKLKKKKLETVISLGQQIYISTCSMTGWKGFMSEIGRVEEDRSKLRIKNVSLFVDERFRLLIQMKSISLWIFFYLKYIKVCNPILVKFFKQFNDFFSFCLQWNFFFFFNKSCSITEKLFS